MNLKELLNKYKGTRLSYASVRRKAETELLEGVVKSVEELLDADRRRGGRPKKDAA
jgi:hypothetical protein